MVDKVSDRRSQGDNACENSGGDKHSLVVHCAEGGNLDSVQVCKAAAHPACKQPDTLYQAISPKKYSTFKKIVKITDLKFLTKIPV